MANIWNKFSPQRWESPTKAIEWENESRTLVTEVELGDTTTVIPFSVFCELLSDNGYQVVEHREVSRIQIALEELIQESAHHEADMREAQAEVYKAREEFRCIMIQKDIMERDLKKVLDILEFDTGALKKKVAEVDALTLDNARLKVTQQDIMKSAMAEIARLRGKCAE